MSSPTVEDQIAPSTASDLSNTESNPSEAFLESPASLEQGHDIQQASDTLNGNHSHNHHQHHKSQKWKNHNSNPPPTNCVVLKNLDYSMTHVTLEEVVRRVTGDRMGFVNITLVEDKATHSFRGVAFVNFHTTEDATAALAELGKMVINGRKVVAEYRRMKPGDRERKVQQEKRAKRFETNADRQTFERDIPETTDAQGKKVDKRTAFFAKRDTVRKADEQKRHDERVERDRERENLFRKLLLEYGEGEMEEDGAAKDLVFDASLTPYERKMVHQICSELGLGHISRFDDEGNRVLYVTKDPQRTVEWEKEAKEAKTEARKEAQEQKRKNKENNEWKRAEPVSGGALTREEKDGINWFKPRSAMAETVEGNAASTNGIRAPSYKVYIPPHKPTGPDGTIGFTSRSKLKSVKEDASIENGASQTNGHSFEDIAAVFSTEETTDLANGSDGERGTRKSGNGSHTVLNPSVPAFSPSYAPTY